LVVRSNRRTFALLGVALAAAMTGCSFFVSTSGLIVDENAHPDGGAAEAATAERPTSPTADGSPSEAPQEAGTDASKADAAVPQASTPGTIRCGPSPTTGLVLVCEGATPLCCWAEPATGPKCLPANRACGASGDDGHVAELACEQAADCPSGGVCCVEPTALLSFKTSCSSCADGRACATDAECVSESCVAWSCAKGPFIRTCGGKGFDPYFCF
jgi:hypothetical protein